MMKPTIGSRLGNYRLVRPLGTGGFADVYLGEHVYLETKSAIKVLHVDSGFASKESERFLTEARTIAQLHHPNIVGILEFGVEHDLPYLVMEYAPHGSLRAKHPKGSMLPLSAVLLYIGQVAAALQHAHEHRIVHCDVKPENMLLGQDDRLLLSDFGIARVVRNTIQTQDAVGTIYYMAPEQFGGKPIPASDQYALAVSVYQWLSGQLPFEGGNVGEMFVMHTKMQPPSLSKLVPSISPALEQVIMKALAKEPQQRFPDVATFAAAFEGAAMPTLASGVPALPSVFSLAPAHFIKNAPTFIDDDAAFSMGTFLGAGVSQAAPPLPSRSDYSDDSADELPLLPSAIDSVVPTANFLIGEPIEPAESTESTEPTVAEAHNVQVAFSAEPPSWASPWNVQAPPFHAIGNAPDDSAYVPLLLSSSGLLPWLDTKQEDVVQEAVAFVPPVEPSELVLLTPISDLLPPMKVLEDDIATVLIPPQPQPPAPSEAAPESEPTVVAEPKPEPAPKPELSLKPEPTSPELVGPSTQFASTIVMKDAVGSLFFISYDASDRDWARWIAWHLRQAGRTVIPFEGTAQSGANVAAEIQEALTQTEYVIAVISPKYLHARSNQSDWTTIFKRDAAGEQSRILPVCVRDCGQMFERLLDTPDYINLIGLDKQAANKALLDGVREWIQPVFPGDSTLIFPGSSLEPPLPPNPTTRGVEIFISYSHLDRRYRTDLDKYLLTLKINYSAISWHDGEIRPGVDFEQEIDRHLRKAHIILLLVSQNFIASDYCREKELKPAMERHATGEAHVIPVILQPCLWRKTLFGKLQALPRDGKAITLLKNRAAAYTDITEGVEKVIMQILRNPMVK